MTTIFFPVLPIKINKTALFVDESRAVGVIREDGFVGTRRRLMKESMRNLALFVFARSESLGLDSDEVFDKVESVAGICFRSHYPFAITLEKLVVINDAINSFIS